MDIVIPDEFKPLYTPEHHKPIVKIPDPVLRKAAAEVRKIGPKTKSLVETMLRTMQRANGIGLAAPQIAVLERVIVIAPPGTKPMPMINPLIKHSEGEQVGQEGCLSIPGLYGDVTRATKIVVHYDDLKGAFWEVELEGLSARVVQHEVDHLNGVLFIDKADPATLHWHTPGIDDAE